MSADLHFFDESALLHRLSNALQKRHQETVFLLGSALSAPVHPTALGVPGTDGVIKLIRSEFADDSTETDQFDHAIRLAGDREYQTAFLFIQGRRGQDTANEIVRKAVLKSRVGQPGKTNFDIHAATDEDCRVLDFDSQWFLNPGTESVGKLVTFYPERFGRVVLTTNFDPLIEVAIRKAGGQVYKTTLHSDGGLSQTDGPGCHIVHLHGYWYGSDTLHTSRQLQQSRPHLKASLGSLLRSKLVLVCGYGGWDDVFIESLIEVVQDDSAYPEILWTFHASKPAIPEALIQRFSPGLSRGRLSLYGGIDCNVLFPKLWNRWSTLERGVSSPKIAPTNPVVISDSIKQELNQRPLQPGCWRVTMRIDHHLLKYA